MNLTLRQFPLILGVFAAWALICTLLYGLYTNLGGFAQWTEWILGGQLIWFPWTLFVLLIFSQTKIINQRTSSTLLKILHHTFLAAGVVIIHAAYTRLIRPIPPMILYGHNYSDVFNRFRFVGYLSPERVLLDLALYLAVLVAAIFHQAKFQSQPANSLELVTVPPLPESIEPNTSVDRLMVRLIDRTIVLPVDEIEWVEAADYYVKLHARGEELLHRQSIQSLERVLNPGNFLRVHRKALVNKDRIVQLVSLGESNWGVTMRSGAVVPISRRRRRQVETSISKS